MKRIDDLSINEVETLCQLYNDCRLSVQEEAELEYILFSTRLNSELIDETRLLMELSYQVKFFDMSIHHRSRKVRTLSVWSLRIAASVAILIGVFALLQIHEFNNDDGTVFIAYDEGKQLTSKMAKKMAEKEEQKVKSFMQALEVQQATEQKRVEYFMNHQNRKQ